MLSKLVMTTTIVIAHATHQRLNVDATSQPRRALYLFLLIARLCCHLKNWCFPQGAIASHVEALISDCDWLLQNLKGRLSSLTSLNAENPDEENDPVHESRRKAEGTSYRGYIAGMELAHMSRRSCSRPSALPSWCRQYCAGQPYCGSHINSQKM